MEAPQSSEAERTLAEVDRLRRRTQVLAHAGAWFPAAAIAALLLASIALYRHPFHQPQVAFVEYPFWAGLPDVQRSALSSYLFWFIGTPLVLAGIGLWYRWRAQRVGMRVSWPLFVGTGMAVLLLLAVLAGVAMQPIENPDLGSVTAYQPSLNLRAVLTPLLPIAAAVVVMGWAERSAALAIAGGWIALLTLWQCGYGGMGEVPGGQLTLLGIHRPGPTLIIMTLPLVGFAAVRAFPVRQMDR
jgi:hypothetical protein